MPSHTVTSETASEFYAARLPKTDAPTDAGGETKPAAADATSASEKPAKQPRPIQPRINELVAEREEARALALEEAARGAELERELSALKARMASFESTPKPIEVSDRPLRANFATEDAYQDALIDWRADKKIAERDQAAQAARQQAVQSQIVENWMQRQEAFRKEVTDYDEVLGAADMQLPQFLLDALIECDPRIAYHLAKNPADGERLVKLSPTAALRELGRLEDRVISAATTTSAPPPSAAAPKPSASRLEVSKAPPPIETLKGNTAAIHKDPSEMSYQEFKAWRNSRTT